MEVESDVESSVTEEPLRIENPLAATVDKSEISPTLQDAYKVLHGGAKNSTEAKPKQPCPELPSNLSECSFLLSILLAICYKKQPMFCYSYKSMMSLICC